MPVENEVLVLPGVHQALVPEQRMLRDPEPGEALVRIEACGVCGSDLFLRKGGFGADKLPVVPGHEAAGRIEAVGDPHDRHWIGRQVALYYIDAPPDSAWAQIGAVNIGPDVTRMGVDVDGAFARYVVRPVSTLIPVEREMDPAIVAVCTDALATPYHALTTIARVQPGERVVVIGPGGIGSNAVQIAVLLGAEVAVVGRSRGKLDQALRLGARAALESDAGIDAVLRAVGDNVDVVVECSGDPSMARFAVEVAGFRARVVMIGASTEPFTISSGELIWRELSVMGSRGFTPREISAVLDLVNEGRLHTDHLTVDRRPWREAELALEDLSSGRTTRAVLMMNSD
ncbi:MAG: alcohol dehydrogenase catalytic domain-containing protein [Candidatus Nanopelagicales bacterium]